MAMIFLLCREAVGSVRVVDVDGRLGYHPVAPRPLRYGPFVHRL
jgi:hypothetical protein